MNTNELFTIAVSAINNIDTGSPGHYVLGILHQSIICTKMLDFPQGGTVLIKITTQAAKHGLTEREWSVLIGKIKQAYEQGWLK